LVGRSCILVQRPDDEIAMTGPSSITHYRLGAGRIFKSGRANVTDEGIEILDPMLSPGVHQVPNSPAWSVQTSIAGTTLTATVRSGDHALLRIWVILDGQDLRLVLPPPRIIDLNVPACIVAILHEQPFDPVVGWLRDLELTLAWAWVSQSAWGLQMEALHCAGSDPLNNAEFQSSSRPLRKATAAIAPHA